MPLRELREALFRSKRARPPRKKRTAWRRSDIHMRTLSHEEFYAQGQLHATHERISSSQACPSRRKIDMMNEQGGKDIKWQFGLARNIIIVVSTRRPFRHAKTPPTFVWQVRAISDQLSRERKWRKTKRKKKRNSERNRERNRTKQPRQMPGFSSSLRRRRRKSPCCAFRPAPLRNCRFVGLIWRFGLQIDCLEMDSGAYWASLVYTE